MERFAQFRFLAFALALVTSRALATGVEFELLAASHERFSRPHDIVLSPDGSSLFVADNGNHRIVVLNASTLEEIFNFGQGEVAEPHDVAFDPEGRLLVADTGNSRIAIYALEGTSADLVATLAGGIRRPEGVAAHPDGRVFATGAGSGNLVVYRDGNPVGERSGFSSPHDVEFDAEGLIWVADSGNDRMVAVNEALEITTVLKGIPYAFRGPRYMDFDEAGRMFVADKYSHRILVIDRDGGVLSTLGGGKAAKGAGVFDRPEGVELRGNRAWFSDTYNDRIVLYRIEITP